jgi:hypothetical protein
LAQRVQISIDCHDVVKLADFWAAVLGYVVEGGHEPWAAHSRAAATYPEEAWVRIADPDGAGPSLMFHSVPEPKVVKNRVHLDVRAPSSSTGGPQEWLKAFVASIVALGGRQIRVVQDESDRFAVMQDAEGNEFCVGARETS